MIKDILKEAISIQLYSRNLSALAARAAPLPEIANCRGSGEHFSQIMVADRDFFFTTDYTIGRQLSRYREKEVINSD